MNFGILTVKYGNFTGNSADTPHSQPAGVCVLAPHSQRSQLAMFLAPICTASAPLPHRFRTVPHRFLTASTPLPHRFRLHRLHTASAPLPSAPPPHRFRTASTPLSDCLFYENAAGPGILLWKN